MLPKLQLDDQDEAPLYRQLYEQIRAAILTGRVANGERIPATRELAGLLGLNRTTVSAAYELLEADGLISGHVGRGSFVTHQAAVAPSSPDGVISFASSRPSELLFPLDDFRRTCQEVIQSPEAASILQLGSPIGYAPLRRYLMDASRTEGIAGSDDDIAITSGCQQAVDLIQRTLISPGDVVVTEDPVYPGLRNAFLRAGARVIGVPAGADGIDLDALERAVRQERPRLVVVTPNFQNPTGSTLPLPSRTAILRIARENTITLVENDVYGELRYEGERNPTLKQLDPQANVILLRSFSKVAFPGLRVGWVVASREVTRRLSDAKQWCDLHTDQLSQAVLLRFAESGRLAEHRSRMVVSGRERLKAALEGCARFLPRDAEFTRPQGGMSLWVRFHAGMDTGDMLSRAQRENVTYLPGRYFAVNNEHRNALRLSFAGLTPEQITKGLSVLGGLFASDSVQGRDLDRTGLEPALV